MKRLDYKWVMLALVSSAYFLAQGTRQIYNSVLPQIREDFLAYGVTARPPKTFRAFPKNTMIQLCTYDEETFRKWSEITVPQGFYIAKNEPNFMWLRKELEKQLVYLG